MERINLKGELTPAAMFLNYLLARPGNKKLTNGLYADVQLTINGTTVSFSETIQAFAASLDEQAKAKAEEMISEAGLEPALTALREARLGIRKALHDLRRE